MWGFNRSGGGRSSRFAGRGRPRLAARTLWAAAGGLVRAGWRRQARVRQAGATVRGPAGQFRCPASAGRCPKPWTWAQPNWASIACSPGVSTPSARVSRSSCSATVRKADTSPCCSRSVSTRAMKDRSIFSRRMGRRFNAATEVLPMPKSSMSIWHPILLSVSRLRTPGLSESVAATLSRTSSPSRPARCRGA